MAWKKISTGLSSSPKKTKTIPKAMTIVHLVSFATEADGMVVTVVTLVAGRTYLPSIARCCNLIMLSDSAPTLVVRLAAAGFCVLYLRIGYEPLSHRVS